MRAKGKKKSRFNSGDIGFDFNEEVEQGVAAREALLRRVMGKIKSGDLGVLGEPEYEGPMIVGYTHTAWGNPIPGGYERWKSMTPEQRYEASALGQADSFSMEGPSPGRAVLSDMAQGNSYWAGLAKNIAYGKELPKAVIPRGVIGIEGEQPIGQTGELLQGASRSRRIDWSQIPREQQRQILAYAEENGMTVEEVLARLRGGE